MVADDVVAVRHAQGMTVDNVGIAWIWLNLEDQAKRSKLVYFGNVVK